MTISFTDCLNKLPLVAVLRGLTPDNAVNVGRILIDTGFVAIEVPLNSPNPLESIRLLSAAFGDRALIGAGTVLSVDDAKKVAQADGNLIVMPHCDTEIIRAAKDLGCYAIPGIMTPTEAFSALKSGADALKLFPAEALPPSVLKAMRAVLPKEAMVLPVGGITPDTMAGYWAAGASGFGLGSALFTPGKSLQSIQTDATRFVASIKALMT